jgi:hypothetical protein
VTQINRVVRTASYEIDWATERNLPTREYLELEDHPEIKTGITIAEPIARNKIKEYE